MVSSAYSRYSLIILPRSVARRRWKESLRQTFFSQRGNFFVRISARQIECISRFLRRMPFDDFREFSSELCICHVTPDTLEAEPLKVLDSTKWAISAVEGSWVRGATAGGAGPDTGTYHDLLRSRTIRSRPISFGQIFSLAGFPLLDSSLVRPQQQVRSGFLRLETRE